jgi:hypothetical protein
MESELADLDEELAQGPRLARDAVFGACIGAAMSWLGYGGGNRFASSAMQGAGAGVAIALLAYGFDQWKSSSAHQEKARQLSAKTGFLAPYPFYAPSVTYPWSSH